MKTTMTPQYNTVTFTSIYDTVDKFIEDFISIEIPQAITISSAKLTYFLLYARYGNNPIANSDINQFKYKLFSKIFQYGPTWEERLKIQKKIRELSDEELMTGSQQIYNHAENPATEEPTQQATEGLPYINDQNITHHKRSKIEAYGIKWESLRTDVTESYIRNFLNLFKIFVVPEDPLLYGEDCDKECEEVDINGYEY